MRPMAVIPICTVDRKCVGSAAILAAAGPGLSPGVVLALRGGACEVGVITGRCHGGIEMSDKPQPDSGEMLIQVVTGRNRWHLAFDWYARFFRLRARDQMVREFRGARLRLDARPRHRISIDGEVLARVPVTVSVAPHAIDVVVPQ